MRSLIRIPDANLQTLDKLVTENRYTLQQFIVPELLNMFPGIQICAERQSLAWKIYTAFFLFWFCFILWGEINASFGKNYVSIVHICFMKNVFNLLLHVLIIFSPQQAHKCINTF